MVVLLKADAIDRSKWLAAFSAPYKPTVEERTDANGSPALLLVDDEFDGITDIEALDLAMMRVRELNSIMASSVSVEGVAEIVDGVVRRHRFMEAVPGSYELGGGAATLQAFEPDRTPKPLPASPAQEQYRAARLNNHIADALGYLADKPGFEDLYKALECLKAGGFVRKRTNETERFARTANAIFRHRQGGYKPPDNPMTIDEARAHIRSLVNDAIANVLAANPL